MSSKKPKATRRRMISCFAQVVQEHIPGWKIEEIASGEKVKARKFSYSSQVYLLMLSQFLHLFSLNEIVDVSKIYAAELSRVRGITPANLNTFSNANRTRDPKVMQTFFWAVVVREKAGMKHKVVKKVPKKDLGANIRLPLKSLVKIIAKARLFNLHVQRFEFLAESD